MAYLQINPFILVLLVQFINTTIACPPGRKSFLDKDGYKDCFLCRDCPDGITAIVNCTTKHDTICENCTEDQYYRSLRCQTCTVCEAGSYVAKNCSEFKDTECDNCPDRHYSLFQNSRNCLECTDCNGTIIQNCSQTSDTVCKQNEEKHGLSTKEKQQQNSIEVEIGLFFVGLLISCFALMLCCIHARCRRKNPQYGVTVPMGENGTMMKEIIEHPTISASEQHGNNMASKHKTITGYLHSVTDVASAANSNTRYFKGRMQVEHDQFLRFVCFSPEKHPLMKEKTLLPVIITNCHIKKNGPTEEIIVEKHSEVTETKKLHFSRSSNHQSPLMSLSNISSTNKRYSVKIKVIAVLPLKMVDTKYGLTEMENIIVADSTSVEILCLWQKHVHMMQPEQYYTLQDLITSTYKDQLQLSTTEDTVIERTESFIVTEDTAGISNTSLFSGSIQSCSLTISMKCVSCMKRIENSESNKSCKCDHCHSKQKMSPEQTFRTLHLQISDTKITKKFDAFESTIIGFLQKNKINNLNKDEIEDYLMNIGDIQVRYYKKIDAVIELIQNSDDTTSDK